jgi:hypothetical protein
MRRFTDLPRVLGLMMVIHFETASAAGAVNWEGHDHFFQEAMPVPAFTEGVAGSKPKPLPACDVLRRAHEQNSYEQVPLPGVNYR